jgi:hypothetical protein
MERTGSARKAQESGEQLGNIIIRNMYVVDK